MPYVMPLVLEIFFASFDVDAVFSAIAPLTSNGSRDMQWLLFYAHAVVSHTSLIRNVVVTVYVCATIRKDKILPYA